MQPTESGGEYSPTDKRSTDSNTNSKTLVTDGYGATTDRDAPATRLGEALKQVQIASEGIDQPSAVVDLVEACELIEDVQARVEGDEL